MEGDTASGNPSPAMPEAAYAHEEETEMKVENEHSLFVGSVVTEEMVMEERRMQERASRENSSEGEEVCVSSVRTSTCLN